MKASVSSGKKSIMPRPGNDPNGVDDENDLIFELSPAYQAFFLETTWMNEKLPIPCERCHACGLFAGVECEECRGKGYRLSIDGRPVPARDVRLASTRPNRPKRWQGRPPKRR